MEYQFTVTVSDHGHQLANGEKLSHGFAVTHPEVDAVIEQNTKTGVISATFWYEADEFQEAVTEGARIFTESANASGLKPSTFLDARVAPADKESRELQLA